MHEFGTRFLVQGHRRSKASTMKAAKIRIASSLHARSSLATAALLAACLVPPASAVQGTLDAARIPTLTATEKEILSHLSIVYLEDGLGGTVKTIRLGGANLQIVDESGATSGAPTGLGNLIVGYNEPRGGGDERSGSHNLVVGQAHNYTRFGGLVVGDENSITGDWPCVSGGRANIASGNYSSVTGGLFNSATASDASVSGGALNTATAGFSSISGGRGNNAYGTRSSIGGGQDNYTVGAYASVCGGRDNTAAGSHAAVSGGSLNLAGGDSSSVSGGAEGAAEGDYSSTTGGFFNVASGILSSVSGGRENVAGGAGSSVSAGFMNTASGEHTSVSGGSGQPGQGSARDRVRGEIPLGRLALGLACRFTLRGHLSRRGRGFHRARWQGAGFCSDPLWLRAGSGREFEGIHRRFETCDAGRHGAG